MHPTRSCTCAVGRRGREAPQGLHEPIDIVVVVVGVEGDPEPARSTAADDPGLGSETFRGHARIVIGVPQGHDVGRRRWIAQRPERAPSQLVDPIDEVRRQTPRVLRRCARTPATRASRSMTRARWRTRTTSSRARSGARHRPGEASADRSRTGAGHPSSRRGREGDAPDPERAPAAPRRRGPTATCSRSSPARPHPIRSVSTTPAPASCVASTTTRAPTSCARSATRPASTRVPVAYWTTLKATTTVVGSIASTRSCVRSRSARSSMNRSEIPRRSAAASHGYVTLGKSDPTRRTVPLLGLEQRGHLAESLARARDDGHRIG